MLKYTINLAALLFFYPSVAFAEENQESECPATESCLEEGALPLVVLTVLPLLMLAIGYFIGLRMAVSAGEKGTSTKAAMFRGQALGVFLAVASFIAALFSPITTKSTIPESWYPLVAVMGLIGVILPLYAFVAKK